MFGRLRTQNVKKLIESFLSLSVLNIVNYVFPLIIIPILIKRLGFENYGIYIFAYTILNYLNLVVQYGFNFSATKKIAKNQGNLTLISITYSSISVIRLLFSILIIVGMILLYFIFPKEIPIYLFGIGIFVGQGLIPIWLFQGLERMRFITIINLLIRVVAFMLIFLYVRTSEDLNLLMSFQSISFICGALISIIIVHFSLKIVFTFPSWNQIKQELVEGWHLFLSTIGMNFYRESNIIILGLITNYTVVGYYAPAEKLVKAIQSFSNIIVTALYPYFSKRMVPGIMNDNSSFFKTGKILGIFFLLSSIILCFLSPYIIKMYLGTSHYNTIMDLRILSFIIFFGGLSYYYGIIGLVNMGKEIFFSSAVWISGLISIFICSILSYFFGGIGAAIAMVVAELILFLMILNKILKMK